jgi:hypothetical protein
MRDLSRADYCFSYVPRPALRLGCLPSTSAHADVQCEISATILIATTGSQTSAPAANVSFIS